MIIYSDSMSAFQMLLRFPMDLPARFYFSYSPKTMHVASGFYPLWASSFLLACLPGQARKREQGEQGSKPTWRTLVSPGLSNHPLLVTPRVLPHCLEESRTGCGGGAQTGVSLSISCAACTSWHRSVSWQALLPCWCSCLCSCAASQMWEAILAGKNNMLLFAGCLNLLFFFFPAQISSLTWFARQDQSCAWAAAGQQEEWGDNLCPKHFVPLGRHYGTDTVI